ncbi:MAG: hypothetical protein ABIQ52_17490 [Vicinamibacterales bacterium]
MHPQGAIFRAPRPIVRHALHGAMVWMALVAAAATTAATPRGGVEHAQRAGGEKGTRSPAQAKIDSQLLYELYRAQGMATKKDVPPGPTGVRLDRKARALVDVRAEVTPKLTKRIAALGGSIESTSREYRSIIAWIPLRSLERLAADASVHSIVAAAEASTNRSRVKRNRS